MVVTTAVIAVVGFPIVLLVVGAVFEFRKNRANARPTFLELPLVMSYKYAINKGNNKYKKAKQRYDILKNLEK